MFYYIDFVLFLDSFINVAAEYRKNKESYWKSYKKFKVLNNVSRCLLIPIVIRPGGLFIKIWTILRVSAALLLSFLIPVMIYRIISTHERLTLFDFLRFRLRRKRLAGVFDVPSIEAKNLSIPD